MKRNMTRTIFFVATLLVSLAVGLAQESGGCSPAMIAGAWGYSETGTMYLPTGAVPYASLGSYTVAVDGTLSGARTASSGGTIVPATIKGTATVNSDCSGTLTLGLYDQSGNLSATAIKSVVYVNNATEARAIITSITQASGTILPAVLITDAKKVFPTAGTGTNAGLTAASGYFIGPR